jgi:hypothetical protein
VSATVNDAIVEYDLHGLAGVRLVGATPGDAAAVDRQLGPIRSALKREPDVVVRFVDRLPDDAPMRLLGVDEAGFTNDAFLLLRSRRKARARVRVPLEQVGGQCELVCERGLPAVPLLVAILNLTVLGNGALPLHASAFVHRGRGIVVTGWSKGGKTEALLAFTARGARFIGDEWIYVDADGERIHGIPEPIRVWEWYLNQLPAVRARIGRAERARLRALGAAARAARGRRARPLAVLVEGRRHVDVAPERLFASESIVRSAPFDRLFLIGSWDRAETVARPVGTEAVAERMRFSLQQERAPLIAAYNQFRYAFPDRRNALLDSAAERERVLLARVFAGKSAHGVDHPYPADLARLFEVMSPLC